MKQKRLYVFLLAVSSIIAAMEKSEALKIKIIKKKCKKILDN